MEEAYHEGKIRALGVSNFMPHHIIELMKTAEVAPAVDQIEVHPGWPHVEEVKYLQAHNILVEGWAPLGGQGAKVMTNPNSLTQHRTLTWRKISSRRPARPLPIW